MMEYYVNIKLYVLSENIKDSQFKYYIIQTIKIHYTYAEKYYNLNTPK